MSQVLKQQNLALFTVPPLSNNLDYDATNSVHVGTNKTLTCVSASSNPVGEMVWRTDGELVTLGVTSQTIPGEYGGTILQSHYTFTAEKEDNGLLVTCASHWEGNITVNENQTIVNVTCRCSLISYKCLFQKSFCVY